MAPVALGKTFEAPRPGAWEIDLTHFPRPGTKFVSETFFENFGRGFAEGSKMYGLLLDRMDYAEIHGFLYATPRPVGAPESAKAPPPKPIFKLLTWLHPEIRRRIATAKDAVASRSWLKDLAHWDEVVKPQAIREHLAIQNVDPAKLDDEQLAAHIAVAYENAKTAIYRHGRFTITACLPIGDLLAHVKGWTGAEPHTVLGLVKGYSDVSNGLGHADLRALAALLRDQRARLSGGSASDVLAALRADTGDIGKHARAWLDEVSYHIVTGYDISDRYALEMPETLVDSLRAAVDATASNGSADAVRAEEAKLRERIPSEHRARFDELLTDARAVYRLRDERDHYNDGWSTGLMRRVVLEAGRRAASAGRLASADLIIDASVDEVLALLRGKGGPSSEALAERAHWRMTADPEQVPANLGFPPSPPPPAEWLPPHAARLARAIDLFLFGLFQPTQQVTTRQAIKGIPVSAGTYEGPACVVLGGDDFDKVKQGHVLVTRSTSPYFNVLLPMLGAIVTDRGGALSHAAIVAREYGIPGVVGTKLATTTIKDGQRVRVDGATGEVSILG